MNSKHVIAKDWNQEGAGYLLRFCWGVFHIPEVYWTIQEYSATKQHLQLIRKLRCQLEEGLASLLPWMCPWIVKVSVSMWAWYGEVSSVLSWPSCATMSPWVDEVSLIGILGWSVALINAGGVVYLTGWALGVFVFSILILPVLSTWGLIEMVHRGPVWYCCYLSLHCGIAAGMCWV